MDKKVKYKTTNVTVYPDRARLNCRGTVQLDAGLQTLMFDDLPLSIEVDSVRVGGRGKAQIQILGVDVVRQHYEVSPSSRVTELEDQIEKLMDALYVLDDQYAACEAQEEHLRGMRLETREYAKGLSRGHTVIEDQDELIKFFINQDKVIRSAQREINIERRALTRQIDKLQRELEEIQNLRPRQRCQARIDIEALQATEFLPELTYVIRSAGWQPLYDIRLSLEEKSLPLQVSTIAQVTQNTGQDWTGVELSVSTARPALNQRMPELEPWFVDEYQPSRLRHKSSIAADAGPTMAVMAAPSPDPMIREIAEQDYQQANMLQAEVKDVGSVVTFVAPGRWNIPSDGSPHKTVLNSFGMDPKIDYVAVPGHTDAVFRRVKASNTGNGPMLAGSAALFVDEEFIGKTQIDYTPIAGELELLLGVDEQIELERELTKREVDKRLLRENRIVRYAYDIKLKNLATRRVRVEVQDQIPVSKHEKIKIKLVAVRPEVDRRSDLNILEWDIAIEAGESVTISYEYVVEHPSAMQIIGLLE